MFLDQIFPSKWQLKSMSSCFLIFMFSDNPPNMIIISFNDSWKGIKRSRLIVWHDSAEVMKMNVLLLPVDTWHSSHCKVGDWGLMRDSRNIQRSKTGSDSLSETSRNVWSRHSRASEHERGPRKQRTGQWRKLKQKITNRPDGKERAPRG